MLLQGRSRGCLATGLCWPRASPRLEKKSQHHRFLLVKKTTEPKHFKPATLPCQGSDTLGTAAARGWVLQSIPWCAKADQSSTEATFTARQSPWQLKRTFLGLAQHTCHWPGLFDSHRRNLGVRCSMQGTSTAFATAVCNCAPRNGGSFKWREIIQGKHRVCEKFYLEIRSDKAARESPASWASPDMLNSRQLHLFRVLSENQQYWGRESIRRVRFSDEGAEDDSCDGSQRSPQHPAMHFGSKIDMRTQRTCIIARASSSQQSPQYMPPAFLQI